MMFAYYIHKLLSSQKVLHATYKTYFLDELKNVILFPKP